MLRGKITVLEKNISDDMIYNWRNELRSHNDGVYVVANSQASKYKNQGFNKSEVVELLAAENFDLEVANRVASKLFDNVEEAPKAAIEVSVVPTKYSDCAPVIERTLQKLSSKEFVKRLTIGEHSIVKADEKNLESWKRLAEMAKSNSNAKAELHKELKPWVEEALLNSVLLAQSEKAQIKTASKNKYVVSMRKGEAEVDLSNATSTSKRFIEGNYADFGLADEFLVSAADAISPYSRLKRALTD
jgi:hypothetical protein